MKNKKVTELREAEETLAHARRNLDIGKTNPHIIDEEVHYQRINYWTEQEYKAQEEIERIKKRYNCQTPQSP